MHKKESSTSYLEYIQEISQQVDNINQVDLETFIYNISQAARESRSIFFVGNGGSASAASHLAADLGKNTIMNPLESNEIRLKTLSLNDNIAWITALANDIGYEHIFSEQLKNLAKPEDVLVSISGSGNSLDIVNAVCWAKEAGLTTMALLGFDGGKTLPHVDVAVMVNSFDYGVVESVHGIIHHYIVNKVKEDIHVKK
jgi:D-sedoheptulose 7-phosphate isomerase